MRFGRSTEKKTTSVSQSQLKKKKKKKKKKEEIEMVRAPCCEKMGLKRGPWTPEEDHVLISYIQRFGHGNWRALPQHAGLMRCGKSCRLRWTNYLRPDIKRGNFSEEEEDTIIKLHEMLGNRWSAIAARIPGRTDNEIKNVWHTRLKKKLKQNQTGTDTRKPRKPSPTTETSNPQTHTETELKQPNSKSKIKNEPTSPQQSCSTEMSTGTESGLTSEKLGNIKEEEFIDSWDTLPQADESLWSQFMPVDNFETLDEFSSANTTSSLLQFPLPPSTSPSFGLSVDDLDFWHDIFMKAGEVSELPEF